MQARWILNIFAWLALSVACATQQEPVAAPDSEEIAEPDESAPGDDTEAADEAEAAEGDTATEEETKEPPKRSGPPAAEVLTTEDVAFTFDYNASELKQTHEKKCEPAAKGDPSVLASCVQNERKKFYADVLWFRQDPNTGEKVWIVYKRQGNTLLEVFRSGFLFEDEAHETVTVKLAGPSKGMQQIYYGRKTIPVSVPTRYALIIDDPQYGELKYNSKVGLVAAQNQ